MKIASSELRMDSNHVRTQSHQIHETLRISVGERRSAETSPAQATPVAISDAGRAAQSSEAQTIDERRQEMENDPRLRLIRAMVALLTGREIRVINARDLPSEVSTESAASGTATPSGDGGSVPEPRSAGYSVEYDRHESYAETEQTSFAASGSIRTADGQEIGFDLSLSMSRTYREESNVSIRLGDARQKKDPLVLNFDGTAAQLTDQRFSFDLDADGKKENINFVAGGSGFLALDRNGDGKVNDGTELFGARSGDGFAELAALDQDRNGWIDENDDAYGQLRIWTRDGAGQDRLRTLREANVGAIALARVATPFELRDAHNTSLGQIRSTGIFLQESGKAGTIQQVDLTV